MLKQTVMWTALPNGIVGPPTDGATLHLSVLATPRLWNDDPAVALMQLSEFPDFLDWPGVIEQAGFAVEFGGGPTLPATADTGPLSSARWSALFKDSTDVVPFVFEDLSGVDLVSFPAGIIHDAIEDIYVHVGTDPDYGAGTDLPGKGTLAADPDLGDIATTVRPEPPFEPRDPDRGPVTLDKPGPGGGTVPGGGGSGSGSGCAGCLIALLLLPVKIVVELIRRILKLVGITIALPVLLLLASSPLAMRPSPGGGAVGAGGGGGPAGGAGGPAGGGAGGAGGGPAPASPRQAAFNELRAYLAPTSPTPQTLPTASEVADTFDFHRMIAALGDYPLLLRQMGLVVDVTVTVPAGGLPASGTVRVVATLPLATPTASHSPKTHYHLSADRFLASPRVANADLANGLLRLHDETRFQVHQMEVAGSGIKLQNTATNLVGLHALDEVPANSPAEDGLPALQTAGISIVRPDVRVSLMERFIRSYALNKGLADVDHSPIHPLASGQPAPAAADELFAEDLVRGYRIDVRDDRSNAWHSLCRRVGTYRFLDAAGPQPPDEEDEGFVQMSSTEALKASPRRALRVHQSLFAWDGWSLAAPRPGDAIRPDGVTHGEIENPPATSFKLEATFRARPGSLPRLRFGYTYRLRARVVDLAGNSVFEPGEAAFDANQPEISPEFVFRRFEPVGPPPVMLRAVPKEGESLERITIRSAVLDPPSSITAQSAERHLAPAKGAQLLAERHGHFDGTPSMPSGTAAYDLASREAGSLTHRLDPATDSLDLIPGVTEVTDPVENRTYWLQTNATFDVSYLPDPFARGVLLLGLPGITDPEAVLDGVNRIRFDGTWPNLQPVRLSVEGVLAGSIPAQPVWDPADRVLSVQLPQGETAVVRLSSYADPADFDAMGVWGWITKAAPATLADLRAAAFDGRNWQHLPFRVITLIHAVQQPLAVPAVSSLAVDPARVVGETTVSLKGTFAVDGKSTGKLDLAAEWRDPRDDPADPANDPGTDVTPNQMQVRELTLPEPADDAPTISEILRSMGDASVGDPGDAKRALQHTIGDTKYHKVTYTPIATTRFREHFPVAVTADPASLTRPFAAEPPATFALDVPNAARPDAPRPTYVLPTFKWTQTEAGGVRTRERRGGGLRIYLDRPWWSSGAGELLGVLIRPDGVQPISAEADTLRRYTSEWGMDPLWHAARTASLRLTDLANAVQTQPGLSLAELPGAPASVDVAGMAVAYDKVRQSWFSDIEMRVDGSYFPFVRLALARYQPISVTDAHLSPTVLSDFVQVVPHRTATYDLNNAVAGGHVPVALSGPSAAAIDGGGPRTTFVLARLERRSLGDADATEPLGWEPIDVRVLVGSPNTLPDGSPDPFSATWRVDLPLPDPLPKPCRISVVEAQVLQTDGRPISDVLGLLHGPLDHDAGTHLFAHIVEDTPLGYRIVFVDTTEVVQL